MASVARFGLIAFATLCLGATASRAEQAPAEVTLEQQGHGWLLQDAKGMTLYTYSKDQEAGKSACVGPCKEQWPPLAAPADAKADGEWSLVTRDDGSKQWAFRGKPLYRYARDVSPKDSYGDGSANQWYVALKPIATPPGIAIGNTPVGYVLANTKEMTLYYNDKDKADKSACDDKCARTWTPVEMPWMASPISADWSRYTRSDGILQWAYKGHALYSYAGDVASGEANGDGKDKTWHAVQLTPPPPVPTWVKPSESDAGPLFVSAEGKTLYQHDEGRRGGRFTAESAFDMEAPQDWSPVLAADSDKPVGNWSIVSTKEGKRQWAYKGLKLFTCNWDKKPGDLRGILQRRPLVPHDHAVRKENAGYGLLKSVAGSLGGNHAMMITRLYDDADGHSHFGETEIKQTGNAQRVNALSQDVSYWQMSVSQPGYTADWQPTGENKMLAIISGQLTVTVSNGETRHFSRGDMLFCQDMKGQGHAKKVVGIEPCVMLHIGMPGGIKNSA